MIIDSQNSFTFASGDNAQSITATDRSTNNVDFAAQAGKSGDLGKGNKMVEVVCQVTEAFTSDNADEALQVQLATDSALPMDGSSVVLQSTAAIPKATLVAGYQFSLASVPVNCLQYLDLNFVVSGTGDFTGGKIEAMLVLDRQTNDA